MHKIKRRDQLAIIRELWITRDEIAKAQDIAGGKLLNDSAIVEIALNPVATKKEFEKVLRPIGLRARWLENLKAWLDAVARAVALEESEWPALRTSADTLPPIKLWRDKFPEKYAPLSHARARIEIIAGENNIPVENLITPEIVRRICWAPPAPSTSQASPQIVREHLLSLGARNWQVDLVAEAITASLLEKEALPTPEPVAETTAEEA
jgi:ribonuclease D